MATISDLRRTIRSVVHLASTENTDNPLQINTKQCQLLAKKASETLHNLDEFEAFLHHQELNDSKDGPKFPDWTLAAMELHRVLKDSEILIRDCCCGDGQWLKVAIYQGNLKETYAKSLHEIEWHTSIMCSLLVTEGDVFEKRLCDGKLRFTEYFSLLAAAKHDLQSLRDLLRGSHVVCDMEVCRTDNCLAAKLLEKLDAEERELVNRRNPLENNSPLFLWVEPKHLSEGQVQGHELGSGGFAKVMATKWLGQTFAWKIFHHGTYYNATFKQEIAVMAGLGHPHIVHVVCCTEDRHNQGFVMELMYKSLYDLLEDFRRGEHALGAATPFSIVQSVDLMLQIAEGVRYIHSKGLAHRDLKSKNILLQVSDLPPNTARITGHEDSFIAKIADFGLTKIKNDSTERGNQTLNTGTRKWMAPEVWRIAGMEEPPPSSRFHPKKMDVYSFGITCYEILSGEEPYHGANPSYLAVKGGERPTLPSGTPERLSALIKRCWIGNPRRRPQFPEICTELRFIKGLLLRGDDLALQESKFDTGSGFNAETEIKAEGPWGGNGGGRFIDGVATSIKQIKLNYDKVLMCIWYIEIEYDLSGMSFVASHGKAHRRSSFETIKIDEPSEYVTHIEGTYGITRAVTVRGNMITTVTSLTIHTNEKTHGPFGGVPEGATNFQSESGRIVGFHGRSSLGLDSIGCFTVPAED